MWEGRRRVCGGLVNVFVFAEVRWCLQGGLGGGLRVVSVGFCLGEWEGCLVGGLMVVWQLSERRFQ